MVRLRVKNFGPIGPGLENDDWIDFKRVTVFIGNQGSGKSTLAKLYSTFTWVEKSLFRGDHEQKWFELKGRFKSQFLTYHHLESYLDEDGREGAQIEYEGATCRISYSNKQLRITELPSQDYQLPQVMYVPAERSFISYARYFEGFGFLSEPQKKFLAAFEHAKHSMNGSVKLPINDSEVEYDKFNGTLILKGAGYKLPLIGASSGFQSLVPVYLVSQFLARLVRECNEKNKHSMSPKNMGRLRKDLERINSSSVLTRRQRAAAISSLSSGLTKEAFINIVEEPEQNLFPSSQWEMLKSLLEFQNEGKHNRLVLTTHSPYVVSYLSLAIQGRYLQRRLIEEKREDLLPNLYKIVPEVVLLKTEDVAIYQCDERDGSISKLPSFDGIPSDRNLLNNWLCEGNELFEQLLDLEEAI